MKNILHAQDGNALIEVSLIMPIIILMMLGMLDLGIVLNQDLRVADSARLAAEAATVRIYATDAAHVQQVANPPNSAMPNYKITSINYCTCANGLGTANCNDYTSCGPYGIPNQYIQVTATATLPLIFGVRGLPGTITVRSVDTMRTAWTGTN